MSILDGIVVTHEIIHHVKKEKKKGFLLKLDFEKGLWQSKLKILDGSDQGEKIWTEMDRMDWKLVEIIQDSHRVEWIGRKRNSL